MHTTLNPAGNTLFPGNHGFTLVELMLVLGISTILGIALMMAHEAQQRSATTQEHIVETQQNLRAGLNLMVREIRMIGFDPNRSGNSGFVTATANTLRFTRVADQDGQDNDGDVVVDEPDELQTFQYNLYFSDEMRTWNLGRSDGGRRNQPVAMNIDGLEFFYTLADGTQTTDPDPTALGDIRSVQVSMLARAGTPDSKYLSQQQYLSASGATNWLDSGAGNPANDNFRRRLLITTIHCRNMGL